MGAQIMKNKTCRAAIRTSLCASVAILSIAAGGAAFAQSEQIAQKDSIIVTATKRSSSIQEVPLSVQSLDEELLSDIAAKNFADYVRLIPGLSLNDRGSSRSQLAIRGVSSPSAETASTVGVYINDTPVSTANIQPNPFLFDVERVEVLRGPQGTLFGEGAMGGVIRVITNAPDASNYSATVEGEYGAIRYGDEAYAANAMINLPIISERAALRAVFSYDETGDFIDNVKTGERVGGEERIGGRAALGVDLTKSLNVVLSFSLQESDVNGARIQTSGLDERTQRRVILDTIEDDFILGDVTLNYERENFNITSSTSYFERDYTARSDNQPGADSVAFLAEQLFLLPVGTLAGVFSADVANRFDFEIFAQETRLASDLDGPFNFVAGAFYTRREQVIATGANIFTPALPPLLLAPQTLKLFELSTLDVTKELAFFGEVSYTVLDNLTLTGGLRWFDNQVELEREGLAFDLVTQIGTPVQNDPVAVSDSGLTYRVSLDYAVNPELLVYGGVSSGYRRGGANQLAPSDIPGAFQADATRNYELGLKKTLADGRLFLNSSVYFIDWRDLQVQQLKFSNLAASVIGFTANAGEAHSLGAEIELFGQLTDRLSVNLGFAFIDAELDEPAQGGEEGDRIPNTPKYKIGLSGRYVYPITESLKGFLSANGEFVGSKVATIGAPGTVPVMDSYEVFDIRAGFDYDQVTVEVFAENVTNEVVQNFIDASNGDVFINRPRTIGARVRVSF